MARWHDVSGARVWLAELWLASPESGASGPLAVPSGCQIITLLKQMQRDAGIHLCERSGAGVRLRRAWPVSVPTLCLRLMRDCQLDT